jgi:hypothetical protein
MRVTVTNRADHVRIEVHDPSPSAPWKGRPGLLDESGRGLFLVDMLSAEWGWDGLTDENEKVAGKIVWFEMIA